MVLSDFRDFQNCSLSSCGLAMARCLPELIARKTGGACGSSVTYEIADELWSFHQIPYSTQIFDKQAILILGLGGRWNAQ